MVACVVCKLVENISFPAREVRWRGMQSKCSRKVSNVILNALLEFQNVTTVSYLFISPCCCCLLMHLFCSYYSVLHAESTLFRQVVKGIFPSLHATSDKLPYTGSLPPFPLLNVPKARRHHRCDAPGCPYIVDVPKAIPLPVNCFTGKNGNDRVFDSSFVLLNLCLGHRTRTQMIREQEAQLGYTCTNCIL
eukprot:GHVT01096066.1.p1 GENE.GHVT01096066.1~~GHVT01096066.1.p1  ORF type:complete len:191 (+),score=2.53 GHVT01096066.1:229-801(+)